METSSDPYINTAFTDIEFNVNTTIRGADNGADQRQTCPSSGAVAKPTKEKCQHCMHINNFPTEIHSSSWPQICPKHRGRQLLAPEITSARLGNSDRERNNGNSCMHDIVDDETDVQSRYTATMKDIPPQHLKDEDDNNHFKDNDTTEVFKYDNPKNRFLEARNCIKDSDAKNFLTNEVAKDCSKLNEHDVVEEAQDQGANEFPHLNEADIFQKLQDVGVMRECQVLDSLKEIHLSNVQVLEQMAKSEPAVKRLLGSHQLAAKDVKDVSVDEDLRSLVDTFLRTNVTGNLLVTRVLRENYSTFQSWLAAHLQVERNAGVARYKQALQMADTQQRQRLEMAAILAEVANRIQRLLQACNVALPAKPQKGFAVSNCHVSAKTGMSRHCDSKCGTGYLKQDCDTDKSTPAGNNDYCCLIHNQRLKKICSPLRRCLDRSVSSFQIRNSTYKGDLASSMDNETSTVEDTFCRQSKHRRQPRDGNQCQTRGSMTSSYIEEKDKWSYHSPQDNKDTMCSRDHYMNRDFCDLGTDEETDWKSRISDSLNGLSTVCETLIHDHMACFRMMGLDPRLSLTEAVWVSLHHRFQNCCCNKPELDIRLETLQQENLSLLNELKVLHSRIVDKNAELFNLQTRLERYEALLNDSPHTTVNKSDTREPSRPSNGEIVRTAKKSFYTHKMSGDVQISSHTPHSSTASLSPGTGFYPILQCSKITSGGRTVACSKIVPNEKATACSKITSNERTVVSNNTSIRLHSRFTASEEERLFSENSTRELTDKLEKLRMTEVGIEVMNTARAKTDMVQLTETAGSVADTAKRTHRNRSTSSGISNKTAGKEKKSWRHSLYVVPSSVKPKQSIDDQSSDVMSLNSMRSAVQSDSLSVQKSAIDGQSESLSAHNRPALLDVQPAATWTPSSQIAITDSLTNTKHAMASIPAISESHKHQPGPTNSCTSSRSKHTNVHNRLNMSGRNDEEKERSKLKAKCVLQANVVSLVSSLINDSTSIFPRTGQPGKAAVSKCLRCQKLFNWADNHKLACSYHSEPLASEEKFKQPGRTDQVFNQWRCCLQPVNSQGCCFGQHI